MSATILNTTKHQCIWRHDSTSHSMQQNNATVTATVYRNGWLCLATSALHEYEHLQLSCPAGTTSASCSPPPALLSCRQTLTVNVDAYKLVAVLMGNSSPKTINNSILYL